MTIHQQIAWLVSQIRHMKTAHPKLVQSGRLAETDATHRMACASAALQTLTQLRGLAGGAVSVSDEASRKIVADIVLLQKMANDSGRRLHRIAMGLSEELE